MKIIIHQTEHTIGDFENILKYIQNIFKKLDNDNNNNNNDKNKPLIPQLHLFPELFLTGYPLQDLCLQRNFIDRYLTFINKINKLSAASKSRSKLRFLLGGLEYTFDQSNLPSSIKNVIFELIPGKEIKPIYSKILLPNYDIFDEKKYFTPGSLPCVYHFENLKIGLLICEDMWYSNSYKLDPIKLLYDKSKESHGVDYGIDLVINLSASPYFIGKHQKRLIRAKEISALFGTPFIYVNRVSAEDELLFDGQSFIINKNDILIKAKKFSSEVIEYQLNIDSSLKKKSQSDQKYQTINQNSWNELFSPNLDMNTPPKINPLTDQQCQSIVDSLVFGFQGYAKKSNFNNFLIALSGGIDSALVLAIVKIGLLKNQKLSALFMPGKYTETISYDLSYQMTDKISVKLINFPIKFIHSAISNAFVDNTKMPLDGLAGENIQSRVRGSILFALANKMNSMVLNTSNKSELSVGYSTLYGDSVGALSLLGDLYKSEIFILAKYINKQYDHIIPEKIISRPPSAELKEEQKDSDTLPDYIILDSILEGYLSHRYSINDLIKLGFKKEDVDLSIHLFKRSEFKRKQFCPIIKIRPKSFGFGHRVPINYIIR